MKNFTQEQVLARLNSSLESQEADLAKVSDSNYLKFASVFTTSTLQAKIVTENLIKELKVIICAVENKTGEVNDSWSISKSADEFTKSYIRTCIATRTDITPQHAFEDDCKREFYKNMKSILAPFISQEVEDAITTLNLYF